VAVPAGVDAAVLAGCAADVLGWRAGVAVWVGARWVLAAPVATDADGWAWAVPAAALPTGVDPAVLAGWVGEALSWRAEEATWDGACRAVAVASVATDATGWVRAVAAVVVAAGVDPAVLAGCAAKALRCPVEVVEAATVPRAADRLSVTVAPAVWVVAWPAVWACAGGAPSPLGTRAGAETAGPARRATVAPTPSGPAWDPCARTVTAALPSTAAQRLSVRHVRGDTRGASFHVWNPSMDPCTARPSRRAARRRCRSPQDAKVRDPKATDV
jgi:hypothetical protein